MLGIFRAALLLVPALAAVVPTHQLDGEIRAPNALITLDFSTNDNITLKQTTLELSIVESNTPCDHASLSINGEILDQDDMGMGSGSVVADSVHDLVARWTFTCDPSAQAQTLNFQVISIDGQEVRDVSFSISFRQTAPALVLFVDGAAADIERSMSQAATESPSVADNRPTLEDDMAELEIMREQLLALEHSIASKIEHITEAYGLRRPEELSYVTDCDSLKCIVEALYKGIRGMALSIDDGHDRVLHGDRHDSQHHPTWPHHQNPLSDEVHPEAPGREHREQVLQQLHKEVRPSRVDGYQGSRRPPRRRPHGPPPHRTGIIVALVVVSNVVTFGLISLCIRRRRQQRRARWEERRRRLRDARDSICASGSVALNNYLSLYQWLKDGLSHQNTEDEEKDAIMRRIHDSDSDEEDTISTTLEEEIAELRAAAGVVSDMVSKEDDRRPSMPNAPPYRPRRASLPSSITSACPTYTSTDESLPAYHEINPSADPFVADGNGFRPESTSSEPSEGSGSGSSSYVENLGRKD